MIRWEYERVFTWEKVLQMGQKGWELVGVDQGAYLLKKPVPSIRERITQEQRNEVVEKKELDSRD